MPDLQTKEKHQGKEVGGSGQLETSLSLLRK